MELTAIFTFLGTVITSNNEIGGWIVCIALAMCFISIFYKISKTTQSALDSFDTFKKEFFEKTLPNVHDTFEKRIKDEISLLDRSGTTFGKIKQEQNERIIAEMQKNSAVQSANFQSLITSIGEFKDTIQKDIREVRDLLFSK